MPPKLRLRVTAGLSACVLAVIVMLSRHLPFIEPVENFISDLQLALYNRTEAAHDQIVIVEINEHTLSTLKQRSPINRLFLAKLLERLDSANVEAVGLDVLIDQPTIPEHDGRLKRTLKGMRMPVILAYAQSQLYPELIFPWQQDYLDRFIADIGSTAIQRGSVALQVDSDGVVRRYPFHGGASQSYPALAVAMAQQAGETWTPPHNKLAYQGVYTETHAPFNVIEASQIVNAPAPVWRFLGRALQDKWVFIGANISSTDQLRTPFAVLPSGQSTTPGVMIHAHGLSQILDRQSYHPPAVTLIMLQAVLSVAAGVCLGIIAVPGWARWLLFVTAVGFFVGLNLVYAWHQDFIYSLPWIPSIIGLFAGLMVGMQYVKQTFRYEKAYINDAFRHYVSREVVDELLKKPEKLKLGGESREITVLMTDIQSFTSYTENNPPEKLTAALNEYLGMISEAVFKHRGTLDKFVGDAVVAFWGAPLEDAEQCDHALACALEIADRTERFSRRHQEPSMHQFGITRVGVHHGTAVVGNFGGSAFYDYTAIGDTVNTAARLEGANKYVGTRILVSDAVIRCCRHISETGNGENMVKGEDITQGAVMANETDVARENPIQVRPVGDIIVKGRHSAIRVYEPVVGQKKEYVMAYNLIYEQFATDWDSARRKLQDLMHKYPDDNLMASLYDRSNQSTNPTQIKLSEK